MITIVGAGFSGLMTAYYLVKAGHKVRILEKDASPGGLIHTQHNAYGLVETAANGFLSCQELEDVSRDINVPLISTQKTSRKRYIFLQTPRRWPLSVSQSITALPRMIRFGFFRSNKIKPQKNETLEQYGHRVFGKTVTSCMLEPALRGVYAGQIRNMSASLIFSKYFNPKRPRVRSTVAPANGMGAWIQSLVHWLHSHGVKIEYNVTVNPYDLKHGLWILATSARGASALLKDVANETAQLLNKVEMLPIVTATLFFSRKEELRGFGILFPETEKFNALGVLFNHDIFSGRSELQSETWILGGAHDKSMTGKTEKEIIENIMQDRKRIFSGDNPLKHYVLTKWPEALPHYSVELENILPKIQLPQNIHLVGNYLGHIGLTQMLFQSKAEAERWSV